MKTIKKHIKVKKHYKEHFYLLIFMATLRVTANMFVPGSRTHFLSNLRKRKVTWHPNGITSVKRFLISNCDALPTRELLGVPISEIKKSNPNQANPFNIPDMTEKEYQDFQEILNEEFVKTNERINDLKKKLSFEKMVDNLLEEDSFNVYWDEQEKTDDYPIFTYTKGEMRMWCE